MMRRFSHVVASVRLVLVTLGALFVFSPLLRSSAQPASDREAPSQNGGFADARSIERGEYLVMKVAMCVECHSPRTADGTLITSHLLEGAPMPVASPWPGPAWAFRAPSLAGLPSGWKPEELVDLLMTGRNRRGRAPTPPMPPFRMTREDAMAVTSYLMSRPPPGQGLRDRR